LIALAVGRIFGDATQRQVDEPPHGLAPNSRASFLWQAPATPAIGVERFPGARNDQERSEFGNTPFLVRGKAVERH